MSQPSVIVVDDDRDVRETLGQRLKIVGFNVTLCSRFIEATDHIYSGFPGVIITDVRMPGKDGIALLEKCLMEDPELLVIILTAYADRELIVKAMSIGAANVFEKPCAADTLIEEVNKCWVERQDRLEKRKRRASRYAIGWGARVPEDASLPVQLEFFEKILIEKSLKRHKGAVADVAREFQIPQSTLYDRIKKLRIDIKNFKQKSIH